MDALNALRASVSAVPPTHCLDAPMQTCLQSGIEHILTPRPRKFCEEHMDEDASEGESANPFQRQSPERIVTSIPRSLVCIKEAVEAAIFILFSSKPLQTCTA
ncbi:hypothetical protein A0H81_08480 [Grifola frondosa]|uniref:Uncharacterized protein n=1 Tax=Grifola frondosa TaxID=5627 RepID=A0A1C7M3U9_GRIFR|nr:hypothetical protein A0H81_08480 [Grifola frondosa]